MYTSCYLWYIWYNMQLYAFTTGHQKWETAQKRSSCGAGCGPLSSLITKPCWSACELQPPSSTRWPRIGKANARRCRAKVAAGVGLPSTAKPWTAYHAAWLQSASQRTNGYSKHVNGSQHPAGKTCRAFTVHRCMHARLIDGSPK